VAHQRQRGDAAPKERVGELRVEYVCREARLVALHRLALHHALGDLLQPPKVAQQEAHLVKG
jgi:hypothetical protein